MTHNVTAQYRDYLLQTTGRTHELAAYDVDQTQYFLLLDSSLLLNGGFETAGGGGADVWANWSETVGNGALANEIALIHEGVDACKMTAGATSNTRVYQTLTVVPNTEYRLRFWTRGDGTHEGQYNIYDETNGAQILALRVPTGVTGTTYTAVVKEFTTPAGCVSIRLDLRCPDTDTGVCYYDDCAVFSVDDDYYILMESGDKIFYEESVNDAATYVLNAQFRDYLLTAEQVDRD